MATDNRQGFGLAHLGSSSYHGGFSRLRQARFNMATTRDGCQPTLRKVFPPHRFEPAAAPAPSWAVVDPACRSVQRRSRRTCKGSWQPDLRESERYRFGTPRRLRGLCQWKGKNCEMPPAKTRVAAGRFCCLRCCRVEGGGISPTREVRTSITAIAPFLGSCGLVCLLPPRAGVCNRPCHKCWFQFKEHEMMRRAFFGAIALLGTLAFCHAAWAQPPDGPPRRPDPKQLFERMDRNDDGKVSRDEVPEQTPEQFKSLWRRADADNDQAVTLDEFKAALARVGARFGRVGGSSAGDGPPFGRFGAGPASDRPGGGFGRPPFGAGRPEGVRPPAGPEARVPKTGPAATGAPRFGPPMWPRVGGWAYQPGRYARGLAAFGRMGRYGPTGHFAAWGHFHWGGHCLPWARSPFGPPPAIGRDGRGPFRPGQLVPGRSFGRTPLGITRGVLPDPKTVFARLDKDKNGQLSLDEFTAGMKAFHPMWKGPGAAVPGGPKPPHGRKAAPGKPPGSPKAESAHRPGPPPKVGPPDRGPRDRGPAPEHKRGGPRPKAEGEEKPA